MIRHLVGGLAVASALGIPGAAVAQSGVPDPWKKVPAAPTSCFQDTAYDARLNAVTQELIADGRRQDALNQKLLERFNSMDPMEKMNRMQQWMMKNPQAAAKMIDASANLGADASTTMTDVAAATERLDQSLAGHKKALDAAIDQALKPLLQKEADLVKAKTHLVGEASVRAFMTPAGYAEYLAVIAEENAAAEKACASFFGPKGTMHAWLDQFRSEVLDKQLAFNAANEAAMMQQVAIIETPDSRYQSLGAIEAARSYVGRLEKVSGLRRRKATPTISPP